MKHSFCCCLFFVLHFLATSSGMWNLSSPTRDQTHIPCIGSAVFTSGLPVESLEHSFYQYSLCILFIWVNLSRSSSSSPFSSWHVKPNSFLYSAQGPELWVPQGERDLEGDWRRTPGNNVGGFLLDLTWGGLPTLGN